MRGGHAPSPPLPPPPRPFRELGHRRSHWHSRHATRRSRFNSRKTIPTSHRRCFNGVRGEGEGDAGGFPGIGPINSLERINQTPMRPSSNMVISHCYANGLFNKYRWSHYNRNSGGETLLLAGRRERDGQRYRKENKNISRRRSVWQRRRTSPPTRRPQGCRSHSATIRTNHLLSSLFQLVSFNTITIITITSSI